MAESTPNFPKLEEAVLASWREHGTFGQIQNDRRSAERFIFWEGPPYANGKPGIHHILARAYKDAVARYQTMRGKFVDRKAGWDTHGLPTELDVEKKLGVKVKRDIEEKIGIERFVEECRRTAFGHVEEWSKLTERMAYWVDLDHAYISYTNNYMESVWWVLGRAWEQKLLEEDFKVVPWCTRCGTALSSHELAQGYKVVPDRSVYLKFELVDEPGTFVLAWTTTPWTLPGNVALAVDKKVEYLKVRLETSLERGLKNGGKLFLSPGNYIFAKSRLEKLIEEGNYFVDVENAPVILGAKLVGQKYKPLFNFLDLGKESDKKAYYIADADFVSTEEGTGVVHTAVMYGEDDFNLGKKLDLPMVHTVGLDGKFNKLVKPWVGKYVKDPEVENAIVEELRSTGKLFAEKPVEHEYPFCWRCGTPVIYFAKTTWFIRMSKLRKELLEANETVNWVPSYIKEGRFGEWLREVKDWAIARDRYWGVPLPIWRCDHCGELEFVSDYAALRSKIPPRNTYWFVRHGEAGITLNNTLNSDPSHTGAEFQLTPKGRTQAEEAGKELSSESIDLIVTSPFPRAKETAEAIARATGAKLIVDAGFSELKVGTEFEGETVEHYHTWFGDVHERFTRKPAGGETWLELRERQVAALRALDAKYEGKRIVVVSHRDPLLMLAWAASGSDDEEDAIRMPRPDFAKPFQVDFRNIAFNAAGHFDPHRPYIDGVTWKCAACGTGTMRRVPEVADVWLDSGSMPFAQWHYPLEGKDKVDGHESFPADFISEGIDQTRGWFYTLMAVSVLVKRGAPYRNVVSLGLVNDAKGRKMSKSVGNVVDPWEQIEKYGVDAVRWHLFTTSAAGDFKNYDERAIGDVLRKVFLILSNTITYWEINSGAEGAFSISGEEGERMLDSWIRALARHTFESVTAHLDHYDLTRAGREVAEFVTALSTWYLRRSRDRFKGEGSDVAGKNLHLMLKVAVRMLAPFAPLTADAFWARLHRVSIEDIGTRSVHQELWDGMHRELAPLTAGSDSPKVLEEMEVVRSIAETGHALRRKRNLKVRQPLGQLVVGGRKLSDGARELLQQELNVQAVVTGTVPETAEWERGEAGGTTLGLDSTVTDELKELGMVRETVRAINQLRKAGGLTPDAHPRLSAASSSEILRRFLELYRSPLIAGGRLAELTVSEPGIATTEEERLSFPEGVLELKLKP